MFLNKYMIFFLSIVLEGNAALAYNRSELFITWSGENDIGCFLMSPRGQQTYHVPNKMESTDRKIVLIGNSVERGAYTISCEVIAKRDSRRLKFKVFLQNGNEILFTFDGFTGNSVSDYYKFEIP
ncbi:hypothetical protein [Zavarzinia aquatilis]|uniref:hypothetical protein n=1 Tax=Zavarzinia aquatilis TaxID=2211142 RepID=UPI001058023C|nr:hypothetical protein [Zavarzinia aquatilis]